MPRPLVKFFEHPLDFELELESWTVWRMRAFHWAEYLEPAHSPGTLRRGAQGRTKSYAKYSTASNALCPSLGNCSLLGEDV